MNTHYFKAPFLTLCSTCVCQLSDTVVIFVTDDYLCRKTWKMPANMMCLCAYFSRSQRLRDMCRI